MIQVESRLCGFSRRIVAGDGERKATDVHYTDHIAFKGFYKL